jgi:hypothetical protein
VVGRGRSLLMWLFGDRGVGWTFLVVWFIYGLSGILQSKLVMIYVVISMM